LGLTNAYLLQTKNLDAILRAIRGAQAPEKFTVKFLEQLGFKSTNDRSIIGVLKGFNFIDDAGTPKQRYYEYLDETQHKAVLGQAIQDAYGDLFKVNNKANEFTQTEIKNKLKTLTQGGKGDAVLSKMAMTFANLCKHATFGAPPAKKPLEEPATKKAEDKKQPEDGDDKKQRPMNLSYVINIELPPTRDSAVYEAIFRALKEHIL
jgi:hypothetical protein